MSNEFDLGYYKDRASLNGRYEKQLSRMTRSNNETSSVESAVRGCMDKISSGARSLVIYGDPQSGKTEMMICLTAKLLDEGTSTIVHLMNDSVDLLSQNMKRFQRSGLAPAPRSIAEVSSASASLPRELIVFGKKNAKDLRKLLDCLSEQPRGPVTVIDDEADYATPNGKVNQGEVTKINKLVGELIGDDGYYIGVTATPARLDLNNTFENDTEQWVRFPAHSHYTGQETFFPLDTSSAVQYRRTLIASPDPEKDTRDAITRFIVTAAYLNTRDGVEEENWTMLVHTSGRKVDHNEDRRIVEAYLDGLLDSESDAFEKIAQQAFETARAIYPDADAKSIVTYIVENASRTSHFVINSERDRKALGDSATEPTSPFTIIIGGNIVSRGVTFPNLLSMYFTRNVKTKLQQDTYIQRARMFGARGRYLSHFELTIPSALYDDWSKCFVFHQLALKTIDNSMAPPVWVGDGRVSVASSSSIDRSTVVLDRGEMSFNLFDFASELDEICASAPTDPDTLAAIQSVVGAEALPSFLIDFIRTVRPNGDGSLAVHTSSLISGRDANIENVSRGKGFMGTSTLEKVRFPKAVHHIKIFKNASGRARVFYKYSANVYFMQNAR